VTVPPFFKKHNSAGVADEKEFVIASKMGYNCLKQSRSRLGLAVPQPSKKSGGKNESCSQMLLSVVPYAVGAFPGARPVQDQPDH